MSEFTINAKFSLSNTCLSSVYSAGVTVKSIVKGSSVDQDGRIYIGDIILSVSSIKNTTDGFFTALADDKYLVASNVFSAESYRFQRLKICTVCNF